MLQILSKNISAVILFDETVYQKTEDGIRFIDILEKKNIIPGIKVDRDVVPLFVSESELTTQGIVYFRKIFLLRISFEASCGARGQVVGSISIRGREIIFFFISTLW